VLLITFVAQEYSDGVLADTIAQKTWTSLSYPLHLSTRS